jgi:hypothetical protein
MEKPKPTRDRHFPKTLLTFLLYSPKATWLQDRGNGLLTLDRVEAARILRTTGVRIREALAWLHDRAYLDVLHSERGRTTLQLRKPPRFEDET